MKKSFVSAALLSALLLTGCAGQTENSSLTESETQLQGDSTSDSINNSTESNAEDAPIAEDAPPAEDAGSKDNTQVTATGAGCSAALTFGEDDKITLDVTVGEMKFSRSLSGDYLKNAQAKLEIVQLDNWNIAALRVSSNGADLTQFFYFTDDTLQELQYLTLFSIPSENEITADTDNNCFSFTDSDGNLQRFTVVYDEFGGTHHFRLRNAEYVETTIIQSQSAALGEVRFSYNTYGSSDEGIIISNTNFVELIGKKTQRCQILSPVYQGSGNYDNLTTIAAPMKLEVLDFESWGIAAVRVPYPEGAYDEPIASLSLIYFDADKIMQLEHGLFIPDIDADSVISCDLATNSFSVTLKGGVTKRYAVSTETGCITEEAEISAN